MSSAYLLVSHGSRDPRPQQAMEELARLVRDRVQRSTNGDRSFTAASTLPSFLSTHGLQQQETERITTSSLVLSKTQYPLVSTAVLELAPSPLHEQIRQFAKEALSIGCNQVQLLPLFLLAGVHVMEDIPQEVALAVASLGQAITINQRPHLGIHPGLVKILTNQRVTIDADARILLAHGTRRTGGNESVKAVADQLGAAVAYWSVKPSLEEQLHTLADAGHKQVAILPYFLFAGGITDAIAQTLPHLQKQFPKLKLSLAQPIGANPELADLIVDLVEQK